jgi:hypothetical protein
MLESQPSSLPVGLSVGFFVILSFVTIPFYTETDQNNSDYSLVPGAFMLILAVNFSIAGLFFLLFKFRTRRLKITKESVIITPFIGEVKTLDVSAIIAIDWGSPTDNRQLWLRNIRYSQPVREDFLTVSFREGDELKIGVRDYNNFDEIRGWFLTYGKQKGLIKIRPLSERKRQKKK